jgi:glycosyltransferase involved in cell wall biosynthesis
VERNDLREDLERAGVPVHSLADGVANRRRWLARTIDLIGELRPTVVHSTLFEADLAGRRAAARAGVPSVSSLVNTAYGRTESQRDGLRQTRLRAAQVVDAITARRVTRFHAVTRHVATVMGRRLMIPAAKIEVIPRGRDPQRLGRRSNERRAAARRRLGVSDHCPLVLAIGRQEPQKAFDVLLEAVPPLQARYPDVRVFIAGREGRATASLKTLTGASGLAETVTVLGMRDDVADLLVAADVFAFPSLWEGAGGTLLEAMALECPIVTSRLPTLLETVDPSTAELVSPGSAPELASGLLAVLGDADTTTRRVRAARARFDSQFSIQACAQRMAQLYSRVAATA